MKVPGALTIALLFAVSTQTSQAMPGFMPERELRGAGKVSCTAHGLAPLLPPPQAVTKSFYRCLLAVSRDLCEPCDGDLACIKSGSGPAVMRRTPECRGIPVPSMRRLKTQTSQAMPGFMPERELRGETNDEEVGSWSPPSFCGELCKDHKNKQSCLSNCRQRDEMNDKDDEEAGGLSVEAGYEKDGKYAKIKWEKDEMDDDQDPPVRRLRERDGWGYGNDFKGPCRKQKLPWGAPFYVKGAHCDRRAGKYTFYGCSDYTCQACTRNTWADLDELSPATRRIIKC